MSWTNGNVNELWVVLEDDPEGMFKAGDKIGDEQRVAYAIPARRMKAADISTIDIMRFIRKRSMEEFRPDHWTSDPSRRPRWVWHWDFNCEPWASMPWKIVVAKLDKLERQGLITGCMCGCRMDIEITEKGNAFLDAVEQIVEDVLAMADDHYIGKFIGSTE